MPGLGSPILQHFGGFSCFFPRFQARAKYLGDVGVVDDVPLIIAATLAAAVVYGSSHL
jgi:hypothetical protein